MIFLKFINFIMMIYALFICSLEVFIIFLPILLLIYGCFFGWDFHKSFLGIVLILLSLGKILDEVIFFHMSSKTKLDDDLRIKAKEINEKMLLYYVSPKINRELNEKAIYKDLLKIHNRIKKKAEDSHGDNHKSIDK